MISSRIETKAANYIHPLLPVNESQSIGNGCSDHLAIGSGGLHDIPVGTYNVRAQGGRYDGDGYKSFDADSFDAKQQEYISETNEQYEARLKHQVKIISQMFNKKDIFCLQECPPRKNEKQEGFHFFLEIQKRLGNKYKTNFEYTVQLARTVHGEQFIKCIFYNTDKYTSDKAASLTLNEALLKSHNSKAFHKEVFACVLIENDGQDPNAKRDPDFRRKISVINIHGNPGEVNVNNHLKLLKNIETTALQSTHFCIVAGDFNVRVLNIIPTNVHTFSSTEQQFYSCDRIYFASKAQSLKRIDNEIYTTFGYLYRPESPTESKIDDEGIKFETYLMDQPLVGDVIVPADKLTTVMLENNIKEFLRISEQEHKDIVVEKQMQVLPLEQYGNQVRLSVQSSAATPIYYYEFLLEKKIRGISKVIQGTSRNYFFDLSHETIQKLIDPLKPENALAFAEFLIKNPTFCDTTVINADTFALLANDAFLIMEEERLKDKIASKQEFIDLEISKLNPPEHKAKITSAQDKLDNAKRHKNTLVATAKRPENLKREDLSNQLTTKSAQLRKLQSETKEDAQKSAIAKKQNLNFEAQRKLESEELEELKTTNSTVKDAFDNIEKEQQALALLQIESNARAKLATAKMRPFVDEITKMNDPLRNINLDYTQNKKTESELKASTPNFDKIILHSIPGAIPDYKKNMMLAVKTHIINLGNETHTDKVTEKYAHFKKLLNELVFLDLSNYAAITAFRAKFLVLKKDSLVIEHRGRYCIPGCFFKFSRTTSEKLLIKLGEFIIDTYNKLQLPDYNKSRSANELQPDPIKIRR